VFSELRSANGSDLAGRWTIMTEHSSTIAEKAHENIRKWLHARHAQERLAKGKVAENVGPYIVVSRETGAGGSAIARLVGEKLGWDVLDKEIVDYLASEYGTSRSLVEFVDEKHLSWIEEVFTSWIEGLEFTSSTYVHRLNHLLLLAAHHGNVVIVGRGARFLLPRERGLSVRILAPLDFRVEQVLMQRGLNEKEARKFVEESDREREAFIKEHFHRKSADPHLYDLVINVEKLGQEDAADLIAQAARAWMKTSGVTVTPS
jgi:cytidylate kinase